MKLPDITLRKGCNLQATMRFVDDHELADVRQLAFEAARIPGVDAPFALDQIAGRQKARGKLPSWAQNRDIIYPPSLSMEQCSSQATALYKASLAGEGQLMIDLTGGLGVDFSFIAQRFREAIYVERDPRLCELACHNMAALGLSHAHIVNSTAEEYLDSLPQADLIYLDPARRDAAGNRVFRLEDCTPDVTTLLPHLLAKSPRVLLKLSPMLDLHQALSRLTGVSQAHIVSTGGECKEMLLLLEAGHEGPVQVTCVNDADEPFTYSLADTATDADEWNPNGCSEKQTVYLYEPNASIMKAGCFGLLAERYGLVAVARNSHLFVCYEALPSFPGRKFVVDAVTTLNARDLKRHLQGITHACIAVRNFPMKAPELRKRLRLNDGGDTYIFATRLASGKNVLLITHKAQCR